MNNCPETVNTFINDINAIFCEINSQNSIKLLLGDFNIDLLKINQKSFIKDFLDNIFTLGLCPSITLPTRLTDTSATLIDNVFSNINFQSSGLLVSNLSDHFPYFYTIQTSHTVKNNAKKYIYYRKEDDNHIQKIYNDLESLDLTNLLQKDLDSDPNINYNKLDFILDKLLYKHMPVRKII